MNALRIVERNARAFRRGWRSSAAMTLLQPLLFLGAMGLGLGALVDRGGALQQGGVSYLAFVAPGLLAATCMQSASFESAFPINNRLNWQRVYVPIAGTPMRVADIVLGELAWIAIRMSMVATAFVAVSVAFGAARSWLVVLSIPAAVLTGLAFSAPILAYTGTLTSSGNYNAVFRFVITPLFLFSGVYFPVTRMPAWLQELARFTPLYHGVELTRGLSLGTLGGADAAVHVLFLLGMVALGAQLAVRTFTRKLQP